MRGFRRYGRNAAEGPTRAGGVPDFVIGEIVVEGVVDAEVHVLAEEFLRVIRREVLLPDDRRAEFVHVAVDRANADGLVVPWGVVHVEHHAVEVEAELVRELLFLRLRIEVATERRLASVRDSRRVQKHVAVLVHRHAVHRDVGIDVHQRLALRPLGIAKEFRPIVVLHDRDEDLLAACSCGVDFERQGDACDTRRCAPCP